MSKTIIDSRTGEPVTRETVAERFEKTPQTKCLIINDQAYWAAWFEGVLDPQDIVMNAPTEEEALRQLKEKHSEER